MSTRVLGYVIAKNEWPMLGLSISHALHMGVAHIIAVNHLSTDETAEGLKRLEDAWPGRLTIVSTDVSGFPQAIIAKVLLKAFAGDSYDWVYMFDADEFALTENNKPLPDILASVSADVEAIRYELDQFVAYYDMDDTVTDQFNRFTHRAIVCDQTKQDGAIRTDDLVAGNINYFDIPFPSKVMVRSKYAHQILPGAHGVEVDVTTNQKVTEQALKKSIIRVAHLPLTSKHRTKQKAIHGQVLIEAGLPRRHGWQNQALHLIDQAGRLETYWKNHSIPPANNSGYLFCARDLASSNLPPTVEDLALKHHLQRAIATSKAPEQHFQEDRSNRNTRKPEIDLASIIKVVNDQHNRAQNTIDDLQKQLRNSELLLEEREMEITSVKTDKTQLQAQVNALMNSSSWKMTAPLRRCVIIFRKLTSRFG